MTKDPREAIVLKAIATFNGAYADGLTNALSAVVDMVLEEAASIGDMKVTGPTTAAAIRALQKAAPND